MPDPLSKLSRGDDSRLNWREINKHGDWLRSHDRRLATIDDAILFLRSKRKFLEGGGSGKLRRFAVTGLQNDYLVCSMCDDQGNAIANTTTNVAKPEWLRVSYFGGRTVGSWLYPSNFATTNARRVSYVGLGVVSGLQPGDFQDQELDPPYIVGDNELYAMEADGASAVLVGGTRLTWLDVNNSGRQFRAIRSVIEVCRLENNVKVSRRMVVSGGPIF